MIYLIPFSSCNHPNPGNYYTSVTNANEHTLFESTIAQVLSLVGMDEFAYDTNYADDVSVYGSAEKQAEPKIKLITVLMMIIFSLKMKRHIITMME